jgi:Ca2+/Na+ antiporter
LATSLVAAIKGRDQLALGNILGSNVFNMLLIRGIFGPDYHRCLFASVTLVDAAVLFSSMLLLLLWAYTGRKERIDRWEGALMLLLFGAYYYFLFINL